MESYESAAPANASVLSRRAVVKAGAHLAWSVPLVQVVSAGSAHAAGPVVASQKTLSVTAQEGHWVAPNYNDLLVTVKLQALGGATTDLQVTVDFPADGNGWAPKCTLNSAGWTSSPLGNVASATRTFTATSQAARNGEVTLSVTFTPTKATNKGLAVQLSGAATATGFTPGSISISVPTTKR